MRERRKIARLEHLLERSREYSKEVSGRNRQAYAWANDMIQEHRPYVRWPNGSISGETREEMRSDVAEKVGRSLFCAHCRNPWPCRTLMNIKQLRRVLTNEVYEGLEVSRGSKPFPNLLEVSP